MNQKKELLKAVFIKNKNWQNWLLLLLAVVFIEIGRIEFSIDWIGDVAVWINHFIVTYYGYMIAQFLLMKVKVKEIVEIISFIFALFFGETIHWTYETFPRTFLGWLFLIISILLLFGSYCFNGLWSYKEGVRRGLLETEKAEIEYEEKAKELYQEHKDLIISCEKLIQEYPEEVHMISKIPPEVILEILEMNKEKNNESNDKDKN